MEWQWANITSSVDVPHLEFGADSFVHLQQFTVSSAPQNFQGLLAPRELVEDLHTAGRRPLSFILRDVTAAEV